MFGLSVWQLLVVFVAVVLPLLGLVLFGLLVAIMARRPVPGPESQRADESDRFEA